MGVYFSHKAELGVIRTSKDSWASLPMSGVAIVCCQADTRCAYSLQRFELIEPQLLETERACVTKMTKVSPSRLQAQWDPGA